MRKSIFLLLLVFSFSLARSQSLTPSVVAAAGGVNKFGNIELEWTLGESVIGQASTNSQLYTNGFHQPIISQSGVGDLVFNSSIHVYPNPVEDNLLVQFGIPNENNVKLILTDIAGKLLQQKIVPGNSSSAALSFNKYAGGIYLLRVVDKNENTVTSFKIVKPN